MATYDITTTIPTKFAVGDILNCPYSGAAVSLTLPKGTYKLEVWGAEGGYRSSTSYSGKGGYSVGTVTFLEATTVYVYSGGSGRTGGTSGGFNGGGKRYSYYGGGGGSDIRLRTDSLYSRVIVAGGGGSDGATSKTGMYGGGETGGSSTQSYGTGGYGGTQTGNSGGTSWSATTQSTSVTTQAGAYSGFGFGGNGIYRSSGYGGAGGGGWYGGTGAYPDGSGDDDRGGGGGSGYIYNATYAGNYPTGCTLTSDDYLADAALYAGNVSFTDYSGSTVTGHSGDGACRITVIAVQTLEVYCRIGGVWKQADAMYVNIGGTWKEVESVHGNIGGSWKTS